MQWPFKNSPVGKCGESKIKNKINFSLKPMSISVFNIDVETTNYSTFHSPLHSNNFSLNKLRKEKDDLFRCLRHFLRFGKLFGVVPFDGVFSEDVSHLKLRWRSPGSMYSTLVMCLMILNMIIGFLGLLRFGGKNATEWAWTAESFIFYSMGFFTHLYFLTRGKKLISIFHKWRNLNMEFTNVDHNLQRDMHIIAGAIFTSAILENALLQVIFFIWPNNPENCEIPALLKYYQKAQTHWSSFIPFHEMLAILIFFCNKFALYAWNFVDILIILMSRAIYHKFKILNKLSQEKLVESQFPSEAVNAECWKVVIKDYETLYDLLKAFEDFLSPLIFASYAINCFYICLQLHLGITAGKNNSIPSKVYAIWSFLHLVTRVFLLSFTAAKINDHAKATVDVLYMCPESCESRQVERTRMRMVSKKIGLTGLECFTITRPLILKVISVIFTFEIVLLQAPAPGEIN